MVRHGARFWLAIAALQVGCGTGISLDPESRDLSSEADGGGKIQTVDAAEDGDVADPEDAGPNDVAARDDGASDAAARAEGGDARSADAGDTADGAADGAAAVDRSVDPTDPLDAAPDVSLDVFIDAT